MLRNPAAGRDCITVTMMADLKKLEVVGNSEPWRMMKKENKKGEWVRKKL